MGYRFFGYPTCLHLYRSPSRQERCLPRRSCGTVGRQHGSIDLALQINAYAVGLSGDGANACNCIWNLVKEAMLVKSVG
jgi:hypothetical protein